MTIRDARLPSIQMMAATFAFVYGVSYTAMAQEKIFEMNVTNSLALSSGEPMIGVDPTNPRNLAIIEFSRGSDRIPAYSYSSQDQVFLRNNHEGTMGNSGRVLVSTDGGAHWTAKPPPAAGGDPYLAYGPKGEIYAGSEGGNEVNSQTDLARVMETTNVALSVSTNGGKTFSKWQSAGTPINRPWLTVDQSNGTVFTVSSGTLNVKTGAHNVTGDPEAPNDRWLVAWKPRLTAKSEPRRLGGPDFSGSGGSTIAAAHGVIAATFVLGGPSPGAGAAGAPAASPIPASLRDVVKDAVTSCSSAIPCLFFETSSDDGLHWTRHYVPVEGGFGAQRVNVTADPKRAGHYTLTALNADRTNFISLSTADSGVTWSRPVAVPQITKNVKFKQWAAVGPTGVLGIIWKDRRDDIVSQGQPSPGGGAVEAAFDVYAAISCDGGMTWLRPVRVNAETSPAGPPGSDDFSYLALDDKYAHLVWGDRRLQPKVTNVPGASGGVQIFYGRVPFSVVTQGGACGGK